MSVTDPIDEAVVVAAARGGDVDARGRLFDAHWREVWRRAYALLGDRDRAEDVVQDAFERAFRHLDGFDGRSSFRTWILTIATRRAIDVLRARSHGALGDDVPARETEWPEDPGRRGGLRRAVAALDPDRRAVVVLVYWLDLTVAEAAEALAIPEGTAKSRLGRALAQLRATLGGDDGD